MSYKSLVDPDLTIQGMAGWCLSMTKSVFRAPAGYATAYKSWLAAKHKHETRELPNVAVPLYFSWIDPSDGENVGHIVAWIPGKGFLSSPGKGYGQQWFQSIVAVEKYFRCKFLGWTEDINGKRVAQWVADAVPAPKPVVAPRPNTGQGGDFKVVKELSGYVSASDAANRSGSNSRVPAGDYKIFNQANGMVNVTRDVSQPGWWINPGDNQQPAPTRIVHNIVWGDTLSQIAVNYGVSQDDIMRLNPSVTDPNLIFAGQDLVIKG